MAVEFEQGRNDEEATRGEAEIARAVRFAQREDNEDRAGQRVEQGGNQGWFHGLSGELERYAWCWGWTAHLRQ